MMFQILFFYSFMLSMGGRFTKLASSLSSFSSSWWMEINYLLIKGGGLIVHLIFLLDFGEWNETRGRILSQIK